MGMQSTVRRIILTMTNVKFAERLLLSRKLKVLVKRNKLKSSIKIPLACARFLKPIELVFVIIARNWHTTRIKSLKMMVLIRKNVFN